MSLVAFNLLPSALPRYTMPLLVPAIWLIAVTLLAPELIDFRGRRRLSNWRPPARYRAMLGLSITIAAAMCVYAIGIVPFLNKREKVRNVAAHFNAAIPEGERVHAYRLDYHPFLFYLRRPLQHVRTPDALPEDARFVLVEESRAREFSQIPVWATGEIRPEMTRVTDYRKKTVILFTVGGRPGG